MDLNSRIKALRGNALTADTAASAFRRILQALQSELERLEKGVWDPRLSPSRYSEVRAEHLRLTEDIAIVQSLLDLQLGKEPTERKKREVPGIYYGEA